MTSTVLKYLHQYAVSEWRIAKGVEPSYSHVLIVPTVNESVRLLSNIQPATQAASNCLVIVVVNAKESSPAAVVANNQNFMGAIQSRANRVVSVSREPEAKLCTWNGVDILLIDRTSMPFPDKQGVGLARRIGFDVALGLKHAGKIASPWLHTTDGDAKLAPEYFAMASADKQASALVYPFWHEVGEQRTAHDRAQILYELSLRYYVLGLRFAGSPYAFHTIGSTMAVHYLAYAQVRGVPCREAAEDFYLLNKLAKVGHIETVQGSPVCLLPRVSNRVPFGTGVSTQRIAQQLEHGRAFQVYDPHTFVLLARWLQILDEFAKTSDIRVLEAGVISGTQADNLALKAVVSRLRVREVLQEASRQAPTPQALSDRLRIWFDAFRTLKFVHAVRDVGFPMQPWHQVFPRACFLPQDVHYCDASLATLQKKFRNMDERLERRSPF